MKKTLLLISFLFLIAINGFAQNKTIDSLKLAIKNAKHDTARCNILYDLTGAESDDAIWPKYNQQLLELAKKNVKTSSSNLKFFYLKHLAGALNNAGYMYSNQGDIDSSLECYNKSLKIMEEISDKKGMSTCLNNMGILFNNKGDIPKALDLFTKSLKIAKEINDKKSIAYSLLNIAFIHNSQGDIPKAIEYFSKSLKINEEINDKKGVAYSLANLGNLYSSQGDITKALEYFSKCLKLAEETGDKRGVANSLTQIGAVYKKQRNILKSLEYHEKSLKIFEEINDKKGIAASLIQIGSIYKDKGYTKSALEYYIKSLKINEEIDYKLGVSNSLNDISNTYLEIKKYTEALEYAKKSYIISYELGFPENIKNAAKSLYQANKAVGKNDIALLYYEKYITMRDSISNQETKKASIKSQFKYEYEKKATADSVKVAEEKKVVAVQLKQEKTQRFALYGGLVLVVLFAGFMFNRFRVTQKQKNIIELKEKETQQQNEIITIQKHLVEEKHKEITDSINYAERIQRSFLATKELLDENLNRGVSHAKLNSASHETLKQVQGDESSYFVFFKPKDVVSGDFYWSAKLNNGNFALATADSTGHGVPGAIMSLLNVTSLEKAIEHHTNPAEILNHTRQTIIERLKKDGSEEGGKDGMDCSLLVFDFSNKQLLIAAANNPVWIIRNNETGVTELVEVKPDKMPVGKSERQNEPFTLHKIELQKGDTIYTLTDGFPDQFGGDKGKKFMSKKLKELLLANVHLPITQQKELLDTTFKNWVGDLEQVDDVCVIGIRI